METDNNKQESKREKVDIDSGEEDEEDSLTDYELWRQSRIKQRNEMLKNLGIDQLKKEIFPSDHPHRHHAPVKQRRSSLDSIESIPERRSSRLAGKKPEFEPLEEEKATAEGGEAKPKTRRTYWYEKEEGEQLEPMKISKIESRSEALAATPGAVVKLEDGTYRVHSQTNASTTYHVDLDKLTCTCADWRIRRSRYKGGASRKCKHIRAAEYVVSRKADP